MRLIFRLGTHASRAARGGLNTDFHYIRSSRARAKRNFQILNAVTGIVAPLITNIPLMKGTVTKRLDICYDFGTSTNIQNIYLL